MTASKSVGTLPTHASIASPSEWVVCFSHLISPGGRVLDLAAGSGLFDAVVVTNYLYRPYLDRLPNLLAEGGVLIYETFAHGNAAFGKPSNLDFLLQTGELLDFAARHGLHVLAYSDLYQAQPKPAMVQALCAVKGALKGRHPLQFMG